MGKNIPAAGEKRQLILPILISRNTMRGYASGKYLAYVRRLRPLFNGAVVETRLPPMSVAKRKKEAAKVAAQVRAHRDMLPVEWQANIDEMLRRLDRQANMEVPRCPTQI